jgi:S-formylglutathione hydrolase FrmB
MPRRPQRRAGGYALIAALLIIFAFLGPWLALSQSGRSSGRTPAESAASARQLSAEFYSSLLGRTMPYFVFLPPGYEASGLRYPVLYMLHGLGGTNEEWLNYELFTQAERLMLAGEIAPFIIVLPQGDYEYWVDHVDGPAWGRYTAEEFVAEVDDHYRTVRDRGYRAVGGLSMGADGALQLALNYPEVFSIAGAHSPVLKRYEDASAFYGPRERFELYDPMTMVQRDPQTAGRIRISIDVGDIDIWLANAVAFHELLDRLGIEHEWQVWPGEHDYIYWTAHAPDYLRFYGASLAPAR